MKKLLAPVLMFSAVLGLDAATIDKVVVRQQWPWSTDVKVEYKISGVTSPVDITVEAYNGSEKLDSSNLAPAMTGDLIGISEDGIGTIVIDPVKAFGSAKIALANFKVKLSTEDSVLYKIFDLRTVSTNGKPVPVVELTAADIRSGATELTKRIIRKSCPARRWAMFSSGPALRTKCTNRRILS